MLTSDQKTLVQSTFAQLAPVSEAVADTFYSRLFSLDPSLRPFFADDMSEQKKKLMQMLAVAVAGLDDLGTLVPAVEALGRRHATYGVRDRHYDLVGEALLWTLGQGLGSGFTTAVHDAWARTYTILALTMKAAAHGAALRHSEGIA